MDLKQAYASVPRGDLMRRVAGEFSADIAAMIESLLSDTMVTTVGDGGGTWREISRGATEGSPLSPALFNLFIDPLAAEIEQVAVEWEHALNLFADDIVLMAPTAAKMQRLLHKCGE